MSISYSISALVDINENDELKNAINLYNQTVRVLDEDDVPESLLEILKNNGVDPDDFDSDEIEFEDGFLMVDVDDVDDDLPCPYECYYEIAVDVSKIPKGTKYLAVVPHV